MLNVALTVFEIGEGENCAIFENEVRQFIEIHGFEIEGAGVAHEAGVPKKPEYVDGAVVVDRATGDGVAVGKPAVNVDHAGVVDGAVIAKQGSRGDFAVSVDDATIAKGGRVADVAVIVDGAFRVAVTIGDDAAVAQKMAVVIDDAIIDEASECIDPGTIATGKTLAFGANGVVVVDGAVIEQETIDAPGGTETPIEGRARGDGDHAMVADGAVIGYADRAAAQGDGAVIFNGAVVDQMKNSGKALIRLNHDAAIGGNCAPAGIPGPRAANCTAVGQGIEQKPDLSQRL
ncbi:MAG: hypothetical protein KDE20_09945 [Caldilineaceae bacterium]|nr:hypothetical protein [Caldilineaceae bacterium]